MNADEVLETQFVGAAIEIFRAVQQKYADAARNNFTAYVAATLAASARAGGRHNPTGEFGAIYCADSTATMWLEVAARFRREGIPGLPPEMAVIRVVVTEGILVDLTDPAVREIWSVDEEWLVAEDPSSAQKHDCHVVARAGRVLADFLAAPSARDRSGTNYAVFADRPESQLRWDVVSVRSEMPPPFLRQKDDEAW